VNVDHPIAQLIEEARTAAVRLVNAHRENLLTRREGEVAALVAEGMPTGEIGRSLGISTHTVKNHLFNIYEKLGISNRIELVLYVQNRHQRGGHKLPWC
jgi:DNA-binding NarL/FixJ family response regulator